MRGAINRTFRDARAVNSTSTNIVWVREQSISTPKYLASMLTRVSIHSKMSTTNAFSMLQSMRKYLSQYLFFHADYFSAIPPLTPASRALFWRRQELLSGLWHRGGARSLPRAVIERRAAAGARDAVCETGIGYAHICVVTFGWSYLGHI